MIYNLYSMYTHMKTNREKISITINEYLKLSHCHVIINDVLILADLNYSSNILMHKQ